MTLENWLKEKTGRAFAIAHRTDSSLFGRIDIFEIGLHEINGQIIWSGQARGTNLEATFLTAIANMSPELAEENDEETEVNNAVYTA